MNKSHIKPAFGIGAITILMVLLVLCLSTFATLTFFSARADLQLSHINADTVSRYYKADAQAAKLSADFIAGDDAEFETIIPMTETQSLAIHLRRKADATVEIVRWQTIITGDEASFEEPVLPVWGGNAP